MGYWSGRNAARSWFANNSGTSQAAKWPPLGACCNVLEGEVEFLLGDRLVKGTAGDFVNVPRGTVHRFHNASAARARLILTFTPAGIEKFFEETLERAQDPDQPPPDNIQEVAARYAEAAPRYGMEFLVA
jgi:hypothetical protein